MGPWAAWLSLLPVFGGQKCCSGMRGDMLLQLKVEGLSARVEPDWLWLRNSDGHCLQSAEPGKDGGLLSVEDCHDEDENQRWSFDSRTGLVRHAEDKCLDASQRGIDGGLVHLWACDSANSNQIWDFNASSKLMKNRYGLCLDSPSPFIEGSHVHMWSCSLHNENQYWSLEVVEAFAPSTTVATSSKISPRDQLVWEPLGSDTLCKLSDKDFTTDADGSASKLKLESLDACKTECEESSACTGIEYHKTGWCELWTLPIGYVRTRKGFQCLRLGRPKSTSRVPAVTTSTTSTAEQGRPNPAQPLLSAVRNCYLEPLVEGAGCKLLEVFEGEEFGLNKFGQETSGRQACLQHLRLHAAGDAFVHSLGRCEIWQCRSLERLRNSAGPGGGPPQNTVALLSHLGTYLVVEADGSLNFRGEDEFAPNSQFQLMRNADGKIALLAQNGKFVKAEASGDLSATAREQDTWEEFQIVDGPNGTVGLKSFHGLYIVALLDGTAKANRPHFQAWEQFSLVNLSAVKDASNVQKPRLRTAVFSNLCDYQPALGGLHGKQVRSPIFVKLWEWNFPDVAKECEDFLGPNGVDAVQISPVIEHIVGHQWWTKYQPVSQGLSSRSGNESQFTEMVARCRRAGVEVIVDVLLNHMASPCPQAKGNFSDTSCKGWGGSRYGDRRFEGNRGWDKAGPEWFHHKPGKPNERICDVGPWTSWLCPDNDCTPCDMYKMPDWNTGLREVRDMHARHLEELYAIGVTMLRLDAAIYHEVADLASMLNRLPWDLVYQEWWGEYPPEERTAFVGHYRDVNYRWQLVNKMAVKSAEEFPDLLKLNGGVHGISEDMAVYPIAYHDGRSKKADPETATYKNGLEFHQQQKFFLAWPHGVSILLWSGYEWTNTDQGPPGCDGDPAVGGRCSVDPVFSEVAKAPRCMATPSLSPLPEKSSDRGWVCEHRWQGVAGMIHFRKACRGLQLRQTWHQDSSSGVALGQIAFLLANEDSSSACFAAAVRGYNSVSKPSWGHLGNWSLKGLAINMAPGRYCDMASLPTLVGWDRHKCPREVVVGSDGVVLEGVVLEGDLLAIHTGAKLNSVPEALEG